MTIPFLRSMDKGAILYVMQRIIGAVLPSRPYAQCGYAPRCPCPSAQQGLTGVAIGDEVTMHVGDCPRVSRNA